MLTPLDQIATQNHLQLAKAAVPYLPPQNQQFLSVMIKVMELQNIVRFYNQNQSFVGACSTGSESPGILDILTDMRNYCEGSDQTMLDQWIQIAGTMELYSIFAHAPENESI